MRSVRRTVLVSVLVLAGALVGAAPAGATPPDEKCYRIDARGVGEATGPTTTVARITGGGRLTGTTLGEFDAPFGAFSGKVTFTTSNRSTVVAFVTGFLDVTDFTFTATGDLGMGTGKLEGASGTLTFDGRITDPAAGTFTETVVGELCLPR